MAYIRQHKSICFNCRCYFIGFDQVAYCIKKQGNLSLTIWCNDYHLSPHSQDGFYF